ALDEEEIAQLLPPDRRMVGLRGQARGWPAVIALAAHAGARDLMLTADGISATLYDYFAEELFESAPGEAQRFLTAIAVLPPLREAELSRFFGIEPLTEQAVATGLAYQADGHIEVHPLARAFLYAKLRAQPDALEVARAGLDLALREGLYDHAFGLIKEFGLDDSLERLITSSYVELINTGRIATLQQFGRYAASHGRVPQYLLDMVAGEVALVEGRYADAHSLSYSAAQTFDDVHTLKARAYLVAGRSAHLLSRLDEAYDLHVRAGDSAITASDRSDAAWGKYFDALFLESDDAADAIRELERIEDPRPVDRLRLASARINCTHLMGIGRLSADATGEWDLAETVGDPWVRSSWAYTFGYSLYLQARYEEAGKLTRATLQAMDEFGLSFGLPYAEWILAASELGLRHFSRCDAILGRVERRAGYREDAYVDLNNRALRARMHLAQQRPDEALELTRDEYGTYPSRSMYGEYLATRALALAVLGQDAQALQTATRAGQLTRAIDTAVLCAAVDAIVSVDDGPSGASAAVLTLFNTAARFNIWDGVVCAIRASPPLIVRLAENASHRRQLRDLLLRSNDVLLAKSVGLVTRSSGPRGVLSPREREILDHVRQGRRNTEIAASLFITAGTVKSHLDHIF
ncbi:MAG TPA: LuxR C-terminal-related transcriptional regulator, partial [Polyangiaceae bacterium]|nr:LuxR C-terminal-related transcriptional regulator [Polyangiaceae bacterium]